MAALKPAKKPNRSTLNPLCSTLNAIYNTKRYKKRLYETNLATNLKYLYKEYMLVKRYPPALLST